MASFTSLAVKAHEEIDAEDQTAVRFIEIINLVLFLLCHIWTVLDGGSSSSYEYVMSLFHGLTLELIYGQGRWLAANKEARERGVDSFLTLKRIATTAKIQDVDTGERSPSLNKLMNSSVCDLGKRSIQVPIDWHPEIDKNPVFESITR